MLVKIEFGSTAPSEETIDLKDYGYDANIDWEDLTYEQQNEITDSLALEYDVVAGGSSLSFRDNSDIYEDCYDDEELKSIENKFS